MRKLNRIVIHHSASPRDATTLEMIRAWHKARGFQAEGYHYVVEGDGTWRQGRPVHNIGAHAKGANEDSIGICLTGDNTKESEKWTREQMLSLSKGLQALQMVFGRMEILPHFAVGTTRTACPGLSPEEWHALTFPLALIGELPIVRGDCGGGETHA